jgi:hypothetical protein
MTRWATLLALLACGCRERPAAEPAAQAQSCLDRELAAKGLNQFGDPPGTMYPGGTPLFDEKTGRSTPREQYVFAHRPEIAHACGADGGQ